MANTTTITTIHAPLGSGRSLRVVRALKRWQRGVMPQVDRFGDLLRVRTQFMNGHAQNVLMGLLLDNGYVSQETHRGAY